MKNGGVLSVMKFTTRNYNKEYSELNLHMKKRLIQEKFGKAKQMKIEGNAAYLQRFKRLFCFISL